MKGVVRVHRDVAHALEGREPVVALETVLVAQGFPPGVGADVGREAEERVRAAGAVPATIGLLDGEIVVGLDGGELDRFSTGDGVRKVGPRDLAAGIAQRVTGATTVGGTLAVCRAAGIGFMATGGLGGVHRDFAATLDVSADLAELARAEALVVSSGPKHILDVAATAELLETLGVPLLGFRTDVLPLFYEAEGGRPGPPVAARVESPAEAARVARLHWQLGRHTAVVLAQPPAESLESEPLVEEALREADRRGVRGQAVTPFVLSRLHEASGGRTTEVNRRLIGDNARLAAEVAVEYAALD